MPNAWPADRIWYGSGLPARAARLALSPLALVYRGAIAVRDQLYRRGWRAAETPVLPAISVGNLSVGGTGKTPLAAWIATELRARGARPAMVLRGYGDDEPIVHQTLNPEVPVIVSPDRAAGIRTARERGCDVAVLDDAFQHRRVRRDVDVVLISADRWSDERRLLPAGPWRESLGALRRASAVVVTRKAASPAGAQRVAEAVGAFSPAPPAIALLESTELRQAGGDAVRPLADLEGREAFVMAAIGDPEAFLRQLEGLGARLRARIFPDHHRFERRAVEALAADARASDITVCTLKDAVKLAPLWPREAAPVWYVSQRVRIERGAEHVAALLDLMMRRRLTHSLEPSAAGAPG